jgi:hypothetical protein
MREDEPLRASGNDEGAKQREPWSKPTLRGLSASLAEISGAVHTDAVEQLS